MIHENRIYAVISMIALILVIVYYLLYVGEKYNYEYILYMQNNTNFPLQTNTSYSDLVVFNSNTLIHSIPISRVYLDAYENYSRNGRFIATFSVSSDNIEIIALNDRGNRVGTTEKGNLSPYYPVYVNFNVDKDTKYVYLQYRTSSQNVILNKLSIEFF